MEDGDKKLVTHVATQPTKNINVSVKKAEKSFFSRIGQHRKTIILAIIIVILSLSFGFLGSCIYGGLFIKTNSITASSITSSVDGNKLSTTQEENIASVASKVSESVVSITSSSNGSASSYTGTNSSSEVSAGTGIVISSDGYVLTNYHVVEGSSSLKVVTSDGTTYKSVKYIGRDPLNDIAFIKINNVKNLTTAEIGDSSTVKIGQNVIAIGNALGEYQNTVTSGIISGKGRPVTASSDDGTGSSESLTDLIQTDAAINSGNSGGPLVNMSGQVIGINTAVAANANGIGFAIPVNATKGIIAGVLQDGKVERAYLGVSYVDITSDVVDEYNLSLHKGAYITSKTNGGSSVVSGGPADKAGLESGDIITKVGNKTIGDDGSLSTLIGEYKPNDQVVLTIVRNGNTITKTATLSTYTSTSSN
jgi:serine protease Do